jgi:hypothetical protein
MIENLEIGEVVWTYVVLELIKVLALLVGGISLLA